MPEIKSDPNEDPRDAQARIRRDRLVGEAVLEIQMHRDQIERSAKRIHELSRAIYTQARRTLADESTPVYINVANAWTRFAGVIAQSVQRTSVADRLFQVQQQQQEEPPKPEPKPEPKPGKQSLGDLAELYGEDLNASA